MPSRPKMPEKDNRCVLCKQTKPKKKVFKINLGLILELISYF